MSIVLPKFVEDNRFDFSEFYSEDFLSSETEMSNSELTSTSTTTTTVLSTSDTFNEENDELESAPQNIIEFCSQTSVEAIEYPRENLQDDTLVLLGGTPTFYTFTLRLKSSSQTRVPLSSLECRAVLLRSLKKTSDDVNAEPKTCVVPDGLNFNGPLPLNDDGIVTFSRLNLVKAGRGAPWTLRFQFCFKNLVCHEFDFQIRVWSKKKKLVNVLKKSSNTSASNDGADRKRRRRVSLSPSATPEPREPRARQQLFGDTVPVLLAPPQQSLSMSDNDARDLTSSSCSLSNSTSTLSNVLSNNNLSRIEDELIVTDAIADATSLKQAYAAIAGPQARSLDENAVEMLMSAANGSMATLRRWLEPTLAAAHAAPRLWRQHPDEPTRIAGFLTTARAEQLLMSQLDGTFLLRFSLSEPGELVCAVKSDNAVHSFYILADFEELNDRNLSNAVLNHERLLRLFDVRLGSYDKSLFRARRAYRRYLKVEKNEQRVQSLLDDNVTNIGDSWLQFQL